MPVYRKKPVAVEAVQFTREMAEGSVPLPAGVDMRRRSLNSEKRFHDFAADTNFRHCHRHSVTTREGEMDVQVGDFVIRDGKGEFVLCKPDVFVSIYESADEPPAPVPPVVAEEMVEAEGERIFNHVCKALDLDPNDGDCDSGDIADSIVAAVQGRLDRMRDTAPVPPVVTEAVEITEKECAELRAKIIELFDDMDRGRIRVAAYHQECNDAIRAALTAASEGRG